MDPHICSHFCLWGSQNKTAEAGSSRKEACGVGMRVLRDLLPWGICKPSASRSSLHTL